MLFCPPSVRDVQEFFQGHQAIFESIPQVFDKPAAIFTWFSQFFADIHRATKKGKQKG